MIDYLLNGTLPTVIEVGVSCFLFGIMIVFLGGKIGGPMIGSVGGIFALGAAIATTVWGLAGPFSVAWIIVPALFFALSIFFGRFGYRTKITKKLLAVGLFLTMTGTVVYLIEQATDGPIWEPLSAENFCPGEVSKSATGNLLTDKFIPLRAVARLPNVRLSRSEAVDDLSQHAGIMRPWLPYYVFERRKDAIQIAESSSSTNNERKWVIENASFCWTTRECINIEQPMPVYSNSSDANTNTSPLEQSYTYRFEEHLQKKDVQTRFEMPCMPILSRDGRIWAFVRPEGKAREGYQVAWLQWNNTPSAEIRIRVTRREMDEYIVGLQTLLINHRNPENRETAKREMYGKAGDFISSSERDDKAAFQLVTTRLQGIPKLDGFMARPPESDLEVEKIKDDLKYLLRYQNTADNWDVNDVAYPLLSELP